MRTSDWIGEPERRPREDSLAELARRYLRGYAPADERDLARWAGLPLRDARAGFERIAAGACGRSASCFVLERAPRAARSPVVRMLGAFDNYNLGYVDRGFAIAPAFEKQVNPGGGMVRPAIVVDGSFVATWSSKRSGERLAVTIEPFEPLAAGGRGRDRGRGRGPRALRGARRRYDPAPNESTTEHTLSTDQAEREASGAHTYGRYLEEFEVGAVYKHWPAKTVTEADDHLFCLITMNHHPLHLNDVYAAESQQGRNVVVGPLVYSLALGMSVSDVSGKAIANLATEELSATPTRSSTATRSTASPRCSRCGRRSRSRTAAIVKVHTRVSSRTASWSPSSSAPVLIPKRPNGDPAEGRGRRRVGMRLGLSVVAALACSARRGASAPRGLRASAPQEDQARLHDRAREQELRRDLRRPATEAPYLARKLPAKGRLLSQYHGTGHFSLGNYITMISGQSENPATQADCQSFSEFAPGTIGADGQALGAGCVYPPQVLTVADQLEAAGKTWRGYMEDMGNDPAATGARPVRHPAIGTPTATQTATATDQYATRHNPFVYFHSVIDDAAGCAPHVVDLKRLRQDLRKPKRTRNYSFITPDLCSDGHDEECANPSQRGGYRRHRRLPAQVGARGS